jgi:hypothetical protein
MRDAAPPTWTAQRQRRAQFADRLRDALNEVEPRDAEVERDRDPERAAGRPQDLLDIEQLQDIQRRVP